MEILGGLHQKIITETKKLIDGLKYTVKKCASRTSSNTSNYLGLALEKCLLREYQSRKLPSLEEVKVYDIMNVEKSSRFVSLDGLIIHNCVLGVGYGMSKIGLSKKLALDTGKKWTEDQADKLIKAYYSVFSSLAEYQAQVLEDYRDYGFIKLPCGWYMLGDNENQRSIVNVGVQGAGASILRKAIDIAVSRGVEVIFPLHDAIYMQGKLGEENKITILRDSMRDAFTYYFKDPKIKEAASKIRLDPVAWSPSYKGRKSIDIDGYNIPLKDIYIDKRAIKDYERFKKYFENDGGDI